MPWRRLALPVLTEYLSSTLDGYSYRIKAMIGAMANPLYAAIDGVINETNQLAGYIFPDAVMYEVWGFTKIWSCILTKARLRAGRLPSRAVRDFYRCL